MTTFRQYVPIGQAARYLGVSIVTLRRWHKAGTFPASFVSPGRRLYYSLADLQKKSKGILQSALDWAAMSTPDPLPEDWSCPTSDVFKTRLDRLARDILSHIHAPNRAALLVAAAGEIGNNSYDHNLGNWPDIAGTLLISDFSKRTIVLADRGVGILTTLRRIRPDLTSHVDALRVAFTEVISGRAPEQRGNGLKFVVKALRQAQAGLRFWSGDAHLMLEPGASEPMIVASETVIRGCIAVINY